MSRSFLFELLPIHTEEYPIRSNFKHILPFSLLAREITTLKLPATSVSRASDVKLPWRKSVKKPLGIG